MHYIAIGTQDFELLRKNGGCPVILLQREKLIMSRGLRGIADCGKKVVMEFSRGGRLKKR